MVASAHPIKCPSDVAVRVSRLAEIDHEAPGIKNNPPLFDF
jgi:hypothetical protein